jgi:ATP-dependent DNA helicase DinG
MNKQFTDEALLLMRHEITAARGNEVFFIGRTNLDAIIFEVEAIARGSKVAVPAIITRAVCGDVLIHNHPSGDLTPSDADMDIASVCGNQGIGFAIVDNACTRCYQVVSPFTEQKGELLSLEEIGRIFATDGMLGARLKGYEQRDEQVRMALSVAEAFNHDRIALVEAGTGTGKSLAYLIPAILWAVRNNQRVVVSTNTINLQEQLIKKDLPFLARNSGVEFKAALVKGRGNYVCLRKLENAEAEPSLFPDEASEELTAIIEWSKSCQDGCRSDLSLIPRQSTWEEVCCEADQCGRSRCKHFSRCFFYRARRESSSARVLVVNHALLLSDIVLRKETGYDATAILPPFSRLIFDEGHHLEEVATSHLSLIISRSAILKQLHRLVPPKATRTGLLTVISNRLGRDLPETMDALYTELSALLETHLLPKSHDLAHLAEQTMDFLALGLEQQTDGASREQKLRITPAVEQKAFWQECRLRLRGLADGLNDYAQALRSLLQRCGDIPEKLRDRLADQLLDINGIEGRLQSLADGLLFFISEATGYCRWLETIRSPRGGQARICAAPLDVSGQVKETILDRINTVIVTSATLTVGGSFDYLKRRTGFALIPPERLTELRLSSPFDYLSQAFVAIPDDMPEPTAPGFDRALEERILQAVTISRGGAFVLFTSYDLLNRMYNRLAPDLARLGLAPHKQGESGRHTLLARFRTEQNAVLFGTDSFWEGVDVKGQALRLVIIARLPFQVPTEPVQQARAEQIQAEGRDPFREFSVPQAVIKFRQGFGRLIRSRDDHGAVLILDRRVTARGYGRIFLRSLPDTEVTTGDSGEIFARMAAFFGEVPQ